MNVIDTITAEQIESEDLITVYFSDGTPADTLRVGAVQDMGDFITVSGVSLIEGDSVSYELAPNDPVSLMGA